jgi:opacity protein-like surface antigen
MNLLRLTVLGAACVVLFAAPARAQGFITPFLGYNFGGDSAAGCTSLTNCEDKRLNWGVAIGKASGVVGLEEEFAYAKNFFGQRDDSAGDNSVLTIMTNLMFIIPAGPVHPYGVIGVGLIRPHVSGIGGAVSFSNNSLGWDIGGGLNIFLTRGFGLRGDIRRMKTFEDFTLGIFNDEKLSFWRGSAGLTFRF